MVSSNVVAQGTVEYLVIIGIVVVLSLVVVGVLINQAGSVSDVASVSGEIAGKAGVGGLSLSSSVVGVDGNGLLVVKNNSGENLTLSRIVVDGVDHNFSEQIVAGDEKGFKLEDVAACESGAKSKAYSVKVEYVSQEGLSKVSDFQTITIDCTETVTPTKTPIEEDGPTLIQGSALSFDGSDDYVNCGGSTYFRMSSAFTISSWIYIPEGAPYWKTVVSKGFDNVREYTLRVEGDYARLTINYNTNVYSASALPKNEWVHVVGVKDASYIRLYVNGSLVNSTATSSTVTQGSNNLYIGDITSLSQHFNGYIDEVNIWNRALSADEISLLYNSGSGLYADESVAPFNSGLVAAYHLDEESGTTAVDVLGDYNGTLINGPAYVTGKVGHYN